MAHASEQRFVVAHSLRIKGRATATAVADMTGLDEPVVTGVLDELEGAGRASRRNEGTWSLTPQGKVHHATSCADDLRAGGYRDRIEDGYRRFVGLNVTFLEMCGDWQVRRGTPALNDHTDAAYDLGVVERLGTVDRDVQPVVVGLGERMGRFAGYASRLAASRTRVESGERDWFTGAMIDSYHTVWFELHEDLLATLGIERTQEAS